MKQVWAVGEMVKVGFLTLRVTDVETLEERADRWVPRAYTLTDKTGMKSYRFTPHHGLERVS